MKSFVAGRLTNGVLLSTLLALSAMPAIAQDNCKARASPVNPSARTSDASSGAPPDSTGGSGSGRSGGGPGALAELV